MSKLENPTKSLIISNSNHLFSQRQLEIKHIALTSLRIKPSKFILFFKKKKFDIFLSSTLSNQISPAPRPVEVDREKERNV